MNQVKWRDFKITVLPETVKKINMSDEVYFSKEYADYISNSRLKYINPDQDGSPQQYKEGITQESTTSLTTGSAVHQLFLQSKEFTLVEGLNKPSAKLGLVIDKIKYYRQQNYNISDSIELAANAVDYYSKSLAKNRINNIIKKGLYYYLNSKGFNDSHIILSDNETNTCKNCINSLNSNQRILNLVNGENWVGDPIESYNEDAMFMDIKVTYQNKEVILKLKMKADNWTIDTTDNILTLNDLKTTSKPVPFFMKEYGSFIKYHYARQMAMYSWILKNYCAVNYSFDKTWKFNSNMLVVETVNPFRSQCFSVSKENIKSGMIELFQLLKRVAYYEIHGYEEEVEFI